MNNGLILVRGSVTQIMASCDVTVIRDYKLTTYTVHRPVDQHDVRQQIVIVIKICLAPSPKKHW